MSADALLDRAFCLVDPDHPAGPRPLLHTFAMDPDAALRRYAEPEGHLGADAADRGRALAYRRGLHIGTWTRAGLVGAAEGYVAVSEAPAPDQP